LSLFFVLVLYFFTCWPPLVESKIRQRRWSGSENQPGEKGNILLWTGTHILYTLVKIIRKTSTSLC